MKQTSLRIACIATAASIIIVDQLSKSWAFAALKAEGVSRPLAGWLDATLVLNRSNAFGVVPVAGQVSRWGLAAFNFAVAGVLVWLLCRRPLRRPTAFGVAFLVAGGAGNAIDRIRWGVVVDFLDLSRLGFHWVFNLADTSVDVGIALLLWSIATAHDPGKAADGAPAPRPRR